MALQRAVGASGRLAGVEQGVVLLRRPLRPGPGLVPATVRWRRRPGGGRVLALLPLLAGGAGTDRGVLACHAAARVPARAGRSGVLGLPGPGEEQRVHRILHRGRRTASPVARPRTLRHPPVALSRALPGEPAPR